LPASRASLQVEQQFAPGFGRQTTQGQQFEHFLGGVLDH
jgi:hypothetical protein